MTLIRSEQGTVNSKQKLQNNLIFKKRYNRNIIIEKIGEEGQAKLSRAKILVCGAGGLGSTVLTSLASVGIGTIGIVDNDILELSNLNRRTYLGLFIRMIILNNKIIHIFTSKLNKKSLHF